MKNKIDNLGIYARKGPWSEERKKIYREKMKGFKFSPETIEKMKKSHLGIRGKGMTGHKHSEESKEKMSKARTGQNHPQWNGGRLVDKDGYVRVFFPSHPNYKVRHIMEHRLVMEKHLGRYLAKNESVHHVNGVRTDNRIDNLELWTTSHPYGQRVEDKVKWAKEFLNHHGYNII